MQNLLLGRKITGAIKRRFFLVHKQNCDKLRSITFYEQLLQLRDFGFLND